MVFQRVRKFFQIDVGVRHLVDIILYFIIVGLMVNTFLTLAVLTPLLLGITLAWIAVVVCMWPILLPMMIAIRHTHVVQRICNLFLQISLLRRFVLKVQSKVYNLLIPGNQEIAQNSGYALLTHTGVNLTPDSGFDWLKSRPLSYQENLSLFQMQMYHHVAITATKLDSLRGQRVLDIGCNRGGGLAFLTDYFEPEQAFGVDTCHQNINFARQNWSQVRFDVSPLETMASASSIKGNSFDLILCVDSWRSIADKQSVLEQVKLLMKGKDSNIGTQDASFSLDQQPVHGQDISHSGFDEQYAPMDQQISGGQESQIGGYDSLMMSDASSCAKFVIADKFSTERDYIKNLEDLLQVYFDIESHDQITLNVKHACKIERKKRCEQMKKRLIDKQYVNKRVVEFCEAALDQINAKEDETDSSNYIVYVLRQKSSL